MFTRLKNLWKMSDIEVDAPDTKKKTTLNSILHPNKMATIINMDEPIEEFPEKEV